MAVREAMMWLCSCKGDSDVAHAAAQCTVMQHVQLQWGLQCGASVVDCVHDIKYYKFQVESPTSKSRDKTST